MNAVMIPRTPPALVTLSEKARVSYGQVEARGQNSLGIIVERSSREEHKCHVQKHKQRNKSDILTKDSETVHTKK